MLYCGNFELGNRYIFRLVLGRLGMNWTIFSEYTKEDRLRVDSGENPQNVRLTWRGVAGKISKEFSGYIVTQAVCDKNSNVTAVYGRDDLLQNLITNLSREMPLNLIHDESVMRSLSISAANGFTFSVELANEPYNSITKFRWLDYTEKTVSTLDFSMKRTRVMRFSDIAKKYDLSWAISSDGVWKKDYRVIKSMTELAEVADELSRPEYEIVAIDTESTGTRFFWYGGNKRFQSLPVGMSLTWKMDQGIYIPFMSNLFNSLNPHEVMEVLYPILKNKHLQAHNGLFDMRVFYSMGYNLVIRDDTMLLEFNLDPFVSKGSKGLKAMTRFYYNHETLELEDICGGVVDGSLIPDFEEIVIKLYACADTDYVFQLARKLLPELRGRRINPYRLDNRVAPVVSRAEYYGAKVDMDLLPTLSEVNEQDLRNLEALMWDYIRFSASQTKAISLLKKNLPKGETITKEMIETVCSDEQFQEMIDRMLRKHHKNSGNSGEYLQLSSTKDLNQLLFYILEYPITRVNKKSGAPTTDADALDDLMSIRAKEPVKFLKEDLKSSIVNVNLGWVLAEDEKVVISKKKFETYKYPFAYLMSKWRALYKLRTSFFDKLIEENTDGWYTTTNQMTSAETARIINPVQTLIGYLKRLVIPYSDEYYMCVFDFSQIEFRAMIGLAVQYWETFCKTLSPDDKALLEKCSIDYLIDKLNNSEADYHREGGAVFAGTTPEDMTSDQRHRVKAVHFAVPYGAQEWTVAAERLKEAHTEEARQHILEETRALLSSWEKRMYPLYKFLEVKRDQALIPVSQDELPPRLRNKGDWGRVFNSFGRCRYFNLNFSELAESDYEALREEEKAEIVTQLDRDRFNAKSKAKHIASIRRQAGNYPIQSFARELFVTAICRLEDRARKEGLIVDKEGQEKFMEILYVHDECVSMIRKDSLHPYKLMQMIKEECMLTLKGHPRYFCGVSIVSNWYEGKAERYECPVGFVEQAADAYTMNPEKYDNDKSWWDNPRDYVFAGITKYMFKRISNEIKKFTAGDYLDLAYCVGNLKNYFILPRLKYYTNTDNVELEELLKSPEILPVSKNDDGRDRNSKKRETTMRLLDIIANGGEFPNNFVVEYNGVTIPLELLRHRAELKEDLNTSEFTTDSGSEFDDLFGDLFEDSLEREQMYSKEYTLLSEEEMSMSVATGVIRSEEDDFEESYVNRFLIELPTGQICLDVTGLKVPAFRKVNEMLSPFYGDGGKPLIIRQGSKMIPTGKYLRSGYDDERVGNYIMSQIG